MNWLTSVMFASAPKSSSFTYESIFFIQIPAGMPAKTLSHINWEEYYVPYLGMLEIKYIVSVFQLKDKKGLDSYYFSNTLSI